ncbi:hypothetical protein D3C83_14010 [compost metagenome]
MRNSSLMRSLMSTLASIAMPMVSAMPAMPGSVKVACSIDSNATRNSTFAASARIENTPNTR